MKSSLTPELFSPAQIDFLRYVGVRVEKYTSRDGTEHQSVFNDTANFAEGRARRLVEGMAKLLSQDAAKPPLPCSACNGVGSYVSLPGDTISPCPYCSEKDSTRLTAEAVDSGSNDSAPMDGDG